MFSERGFTLLLFVILVIIFHVPLCHFIGQILETLSKLNDSEMFGKL